MNMEYAIQQGWVKPAPPTVTKPKQVRISLKGWTLEAKKARQHQQQREWYLRSGKAKRASNSQIYPSSASGVSSS